MEELRKAAAVLRGRRGRKLHPREQGTVPELMRAATLGKVGLQGPEQSGGE